MHFESLYTPVLIYVMNEGKEEKKEPDLWKVLPCAVQSCREVRELDIFCEDHHPVLGHKQVGECDKCGMYRTQLFNSHGGKFCKPCRDGIEDSDIAPWCAYRATKVCLTEMVDGHGLLCQFHFNSADKCIICGVFRTKSSGNIRNIPILGGKVCRNCVNRTRRASAILDELPIEFHFARDRARDSSAEFKERHEGAPPQPQGADLDFVVNESSGESSEDDSDGDDDVGIQNLGNGLDSKHGDSKEQGPISRRTRGNKRSREEKEEKAAGNEEESETETEGEGESSGDESEYSPSSDDEDEPAAPRSKRIRLDDD
jgi:hypothetical protein